MDDVSLVVIVVLAWGAVSFACRRRSLFPIIPVLPIALLGLGLLVNARIDWIGTTLVIVLHIIIAFVTRSFQDGKRVDGK